MSNLEYSFLCQELQSLVGGRLDKLYDMENGEFRLRVRLPGRHEDVAAKLGERMHLTRYIKEAPKTPSNLAMFLRKRILGMKLEAVEQHGFDRVIVFRFAGETPHLLIFEMFADGNLILVDEKGVIARCQRREEWKDRVLREGQVYRFPNSDRLSPPFNPEKLSKILEQKPIISLLISKTNFGNDYLEEGCQRAGIDPKKVGTKLDAGEIEALVKNLNDIQEKAKPIVYLKGEKPFDYSLAELAKYSGEEARGTKSLSEAIDECANQGDGMEKSSGETEQEKKIEKLKKRLALQKEHYASIQKEAEECRRKGDEIYSRYQEIEGTLKAISEMRKSKKSWPEIKEALKGRCEIDEKKGILRL